MSRQPRLRLILRNYPKTFGQRPATTAKVACNLVAYAVLRLARFVVHESRLNSPWHWYRFPFSLRNRVLWSPTLRAWFCPAEDVAIEHMLRLPDYEPVHWVAPRQGDIFIDVGAYVGWYSILSSRLVAPSGRVVALEPDSSNRRQLEHNIALNQVNNVSVIPTAAWSRSGRVSWNASSVPAWHSVGDAHGGASVDAITVDDLVRQTQLPRVDWMKLDVEGAELGVLEGASETLRQFHPALYIELHETFESVRTLLKVYGYRTVHLAFDQEPQKHGWILAR